MAPQGRRERTLRLPEAFSIYVLRCRLALGIGGIRVGALALRRGLGRHDVGDLVGAVEVLVLLRVVRLSHQAAHLLDVRVGGRVAGQVNDIVAQVQLAGIDGTGVLAEVLVQQVRIRLPRGVQKRLAVVLRAADDRHLADHDLAGINFQHTDGKADEVGRAEVRLHIVQHGGGQLGDIPDVADALELAEQRRVELALHVQAANVAVGVNFTRTQQELHRRTVQRLVTGVNDAVSQPQRGVVYIHGDVDLHAAEQVYQLGQHFQTDRHKAVDRQLVLVCDQLTQGGHVVVAVAALGLGHAVDAVVAGDARVRRDHRITRDLQHLHLARLIVEMDVQNHIGHAVVDVGVIGRTCGQIAGGRTVNAGDKDVELLALEFLGRVDELVQLDVAARRGDGPHDERERTAEDQRDDQQRDEQDLPPADLFLLFPVSTLAAAALFAGLSALCLARGVVLIARGLAAAAIAACGAIDKSGSIPALPRGGRWRALRTVGTLYIINHLRFPSSCPAPVPLPGATLAEPTRPRFLLSKKPGLQLGKPADVLSDHTLISTSTPEGSSSFISASIVLGVDE